MQVDKRVKYAGAGLHHLITTDHTGKPLSSPPKLRHVGIFAETKREWMISLQGATRYGMTVVTAYATLGEDALSYSMDLTQVRVMIVDDELLPKLRSILFGRNITLESGEVRRVDGSQISAVVYIPSIHGAVPDTSILDELKNRSPELGGPVRILSFEELENLGRSHLIEAVDGEKPAKVPHVIVPTPEDLALIMFTSGTTGLPKGVEIMHMNIVAAVAGIGGMVPGIGPRDTYLAYLPLAHVLEVRVLPIDFSPDFSFCISMVVLYTFAFPACSSHRILSYPCAGRSRKRPPGSRRLPSLRQSSHTQRIRYQHPETLAC